MLLLHCSIIKMSFTYFDRIFFGSTQINFENVHKIQELKLCDLHRKTSGDYIGCSFKFPVKLGVEDCERTIRVKTQKR
jgi:hypothetical protein